MDKEVLVLGGLGYIGSHIVCELVHQKYKPIIVDNLSNCYISTLDKLKK